MITFQYYAMFGVAWKIIILHEIICLVIHFITLDMIKIDNLYKIFFFFLLKNVVQSYKFVVILIFGEIKVLKASFILKITIYIPNSIFYLLIWSYSGSLREGNQVADLLANYGHSLYGNIRVFLCYFLLSFFFFV